jgi:polyferredoxin
MNNLCNNIINQIDNSSRLDKLEDKIDVLLDIRKRETNFFGVLYISIITITTNLWAQYVYNNCITNFGMGMHGNTDSLFMMFLFTIIGVGTVIIVSMDLTENL